MNINPQQISHTLSKLRQVNPLTHTITNYVAMNTAANVLLAAGSSPAMVHAVEEAAEFVQLSAALSINIGTLSQPWLDSMLATAKQAHEQQIPWVFDPVAVGATAFRQTAAEQLLQYRPSVIRGNASEIIALSGSSSQSKGADAGDSVSQAINSANALTAYADVVVITGETDYITDGTNAWQVANGHALMPKVTALGCALTALIASFIGVEQDFLKATVAALCYYGIAAEIGAQNAQGSGSFYVQFLDALGRIDEQDIIQLARVSAYEI